MADTVGGKKNVIDRMSSLPDDVLLHIISFLRIDDTTRICFLSTRFQKLSRSIPILVCRDNGYSVRTQFTKFMEKALSNHEKLQKVQKFHLRCFDYKYTLATIFKWIDSVVTASVSNLQELDIHVERQGTKRVKLPSSVFSCQKLKFLKLVGHIIVDEIPTDLHFPCLKTLELDSISILSKNPLNNPLSTVFSVLEISLIKFCELKFLRKNKKYFTYLALGNTKGSWVQGGCSNNLSPLNGSMSKRDPAIMVLKQLELPNHDIMEIVRLMRRDGIKPPFFPHLTHLKFKITQMDKFTVLPLLLQHSPKLTFLELKIFPNSTNYIGGSGNIIQWAAPARTVYQCLLHKLETVRIFDPYFEFQSAEVVIYFLKNAKVLKKLILCAKTPLSDEIKASIIDEPRASGQCVVEYVSISSF